MNRIHTHKGFTLIELMIVVAVIGILATISVLFYREYLDRAKRTVSISALESMRKTIEGFNIDHGRYPVNIDFTTCTEPDGTQVIPPIVCAQMKTDLSSIDSYTLTNEVYTVQAKAVDSKHTPLKMTGDTIIIILP